MNQPADTAPKPLPEFPTERLAQFGVEVLADLLHLHEDRLPLTVIEECARRGEPMVDVLARLPADGSYWREDTSGEEWWALFHAVMILGRIPGERAGEALLAFMRRMDAAGDDDLQEWLDGAWPALFANKPQASIDALRALARDRKVAWYMRLQALDSVVAAAERSAEIALDEALDWAAAFAGDETEQWDLRLIAATTLLAFPRDRHRRLLDELVQRQSRREAAFTADDVAKAYTGEPRVPDWRERSNPWSFYEAEHVAARQARWAELEAQEDGEPAIAPYARPAPKVGRNDPCPCGSGKKYKRCCIANTTP